MSNFSWLSAFVGFMVAILFEEVFIRSGKHPVSISIDPLALKSIPNDPELEILLEVQSFRNQSLVQQTALRESKSAHDKLAQRFREMERDFHATIAPTVHYSATLAEGQSKKVLTPECALNVRLAREKYCGCEIDTCPVFFRGYDCKQGIERVPDCIAPWAVPFNQTESVPLTLSQDSIVDKAKGSVPVLEFSDYPAKDGAEQGEEMRLPLSHDILKLLPAKEVLSSNLYRSCALVGNSAQLLQQNLSKIIDNHDAVIRLNGATVKGYEDRVGSRTHLRFVSSQWLGFREQATEKIIHLDKESADPLYGCDMETECTHASTTMEKYVDFLMLKQKVHTHTVHPEVAKWVRTKYTREYAGQGELEIMGSLGFQAMLLMLHVCEKVDLFGFTGSTAQKYYEDTNALKLQTELLARWKQEIYEDKAERNKYYHGKARRLLSESDLPRMEALDLMSEAAPVKDFSSVQDFQVQESRRNLQRRHHKKKGPPPPPPKKKKPKKIEIEKEEISREIPDSVLQGLVTGNPVDMDYERMCQQDLVNKGIINVYGVHVDLSFIEAEHMEIQKSLETRLDNQEAQIESDEESFQETEQDGSEE